MRWKDLKKEKFAQKECILFIILLFDGRGAGLGSLFTDDSQGLSKKRRNKYVNIE